MFGFICAIISSIAMSLQGVFNTRLSEKIGSWETNTLVQASGLHGFKIRYVFFQRTAMLTHFGLAGAKSLALIDERIIIFFIFFITGFL